MAALWKSRLGFAVSTACIWAGLQGCSCWVRSGQAFAKPPITHHHVRRHMSMRLPDFIPAAADQIQEQAALDALQGMRRTALELPQEFAPLPVETAYTQCTPSEPSDSTPASAQAQAPPLLLLHGFDSSCLEFRRLMPQLRQKGLEAYAVDVLGWGFTATEGVSSFGADAKRAHLLAFWREVMGGRPMALVGASLGGAIALDFAYTYPEAVEKLVLIDAQGYIDGAGPGASLPKGLAKLGISVLGSKPLRSMANQMAYFDKKRLATDDAVLIGRLHVLREGWAEASLSYMMSGGYSMTDKIKLVRSSTLVLWGREDAILDPKLYAERFTRDMPDARLEWVEKCGHVPHLEQPLITANAIAAFVRDEDPNVSGTIAEVKKCDTCGGTQLMPCYNCDGAGYYKTFDRNVECKGCRGSGSILCRACFKGDPYDIDAIRVRTEIARDKRDRQMWKEMLQTMELDQRRPKPEGFGSGFKGKGQRKQT